MALLIFTNDQKMSQHWKNYFLKSEPQLDIRIWPDFGNPDDIQFVVVWGETDKEFNQFKNLKAISSLGAGVDHLLKNKNLANIPIVRIVDEMLGRDMTQYCVAAVLTFIKRLYYWNECQQKQLWQKEPPFYYADVTIGIMGMGFLGEKVARAFQHLQLDVIGWGKSPKKTDITYYEGNKNLDTFLSHCNILICLLPLTPETENILNKNIFAKLPHGAFIINVARGKHLVDNDLIAALDSDQLSGAYLDVFRDEPLPKNHPFWTHSKIHLTPHVAAVTNPKSVVTQILENYHRAIQNRPLLNVVDKQKGY